ncbi:MAG: CDGSH iron-sulfur domain-containing protein [Bacteroidales bacterium]
MNDEQLFEIYIVENGPAHIKGIFSFKDSSGHVGNNHDELYLCRCGRSKNKPFCDGSHKNPEVKS